jgi:UDP-GlcNAc:undecaprenyl-phosphate GlcNAc-1-phosphate transferase
MQFNFLNWINPNIYIVFLNSCLTYLLIYKFWKYFYKRLGLKKYKNIQRIHLFEVPRFGGVVIFINIVILIFLIKNNDVQSLLGKITLAFFPAFLISLKEDIFYNVRAVWRFLSLFLASAIFLSFNFSILPSFNIPMLDVYSNSHLGFLIYCFSIVAVANGSNLIDGVNGLCSFVFLIIFSCIIFLSYSVQDISIMICASFFIFQILSFIIFNYPRGIIFLGDTGAYLLGFSASTLLFLLFSRHQQLSAINGLIILIYPITEILYTVLRRFLSRVPIYKPDRKHLHLLIFEFLRPIGRLKKYSNNAVTPILAFLWSFPIIVLPFIYKNISYQFLAFFVFLLMYHFIYLKISNFAKNSNKKSNFL